MVHVTRRSVTLGLAVTAVASRTSPCRAQAAAPKVFPLEVYQNFVFVKVRVNGSPPMNFILDTGASAPFLNERQATAANVPPKKVHREGNVGTGEETIHLFEARNVSLKLDNLDLSADSTAVTSFEKLESTIGKRLDGVLGPQIFEHYVVGLDYGRKVLELFEPKTFTYSGPGDAIGIELRRHRPFTKARIGMAGAPSIEALFVIDIGDSSSLSLHTPFVQRNRLPRADQQTIVNFTHGVAGESKELVGRVRSLELGSFVIDHPVTEFSQAAKGSAADRSYDGAIGGEILSRFRVIFDYGHRRMILEKSPAFDEPYNWDMSGLALSAHGDGFSVILVDRVFENSPAAVSDLRAGDLIETIDGQPAGSLTLEQIRKSFRREGNAYALRIRRGDEVFETRLETRRLI